MTGRPTCQRCGSELTGPRGHCPRCLFQAGLEGDAMSLGAGGDVGVTMTLGPPGPSGGASTLDTLSASIGPVPRILLRQTDPGVEPPTGPGTADGLGPEDHAGRLQLLGEIARGGMGAVLKGRDPDLGRDLAVKVLLDRHRDDPDLVRRFVEEAQIAGQLQHPGIVPVYELGTFGDRRPYFSMKLVRGRTLAELLRARRSPAQDWPRFLGIFEAICQTMAYAHARGVIHRDLKPSNVMVGSFGEVQVMDWGLAKVLPRVAEGGEISTAAADDATERESMIATVRCGSDGDLSLAGSVMGTPSYMAPEQARGEIGLLDERADVFALGSILCEVLTGRPAFDGGDTVELHRKATRGETAGALARLDACGADAELTALAGDCLSTSAADRPSDAGVVAGRVRAYLSGVQDRLRRAELARVEERARRRLTTVVAVSVLVLAGVLGVGWTWLDRQAAARTAAAARAIRESIAEARVFQARAQAAPAVADEDWIKALEAGRRAEAFLEEGEPDPVARESLRAFLGDLRTEGRTAEAKRADRRMLERLAEFRTAFGEHYDRKRSDAMFARAFQEFGIDVHALDPAEAGRRIAARPIRDELVGAIDEWIFNQRDIGDTAGVARLIRVAAAADPDPRRTAIRAALAARSLAELQRLADSIDLDSLPAISGQRLAIGLGELGDRTRAIGILRRLRLRNPGDYWINVDLANYLLQSGDPVAIWDSIRFASAAVGINPRSPSGYDALVPGLIQTGRLDEAIAEYGELIKNYPEGSMARARFGVLLSMYRKYDAAVEQLRAAIRIDPNNALAHRHLAVAYISRGKRAEALAEFLEVLRFEPEDTEYRYRAALLQLDTSPDGEACRKLVSADLDRPVGPENLWADFHRARSGSLAPGFTEHREKLVALAEKALVQAPDEPWRAYVLGLALYRAGRYPEAIRQLERSRALDPSWHASALNWPVLAMAHHRLGHGDEAMRWLAQAEQKDASAFQSWWDQVEMEILVREARGLLRDSPFPDDPFARGD